MDNLWIIYGYGYIYLHDWVIYEVNVGTYSSTMEHLGQETMLVSMFFCDLYLVGGIATPLKNMKVNWDDDIPN